MTTLKTPRKVDYVQGSEEWLKWRKSIITATDTSIIMDVNPWKNIYDLVAEKRGETSTFQNEAMRKGIELEPKARAWVENKYGIDLEPACYVHPFYDFIGCSLDGISSCEEFIVEIKCGEKAYKQASEGIIPIYYQYQMFHQMSIFPTISSILYVCYLEGKEPITIWFDRQEVLIDYMTLKIKEFYNKYLKDGETPDNPSSYVDLDLSDDYERKTRLEMNLHNREKICEKIKYLQGLVDCLEKEIIKDCEEESVKLGRFKCKRYEVKGSVDYSKIEALKGLNLDSYRKPSRTQWRIS